MRGRKTPEPAVCSRRRRTAHSGHNLTTASCAAANVIKRCTVCSPGQLQPHFHQIRSKTLRTPDSSSAPLRNKRAFSAHMWRFWGHGGGGGGCLSCARAGLGSFGTLLVYNKTGEAAHGGRGSNRVSERNPSCAPPGRITARDKQRGAFLFSACQRSLLFFFT